MSIENDKSEESDDPAADDPGNELVDARWSQGIQVGNHNTQTNILGSTVDPSSRVVKWFAWTAAAVLSGAGLVAVLVLVNSPAAEGPAPAASGDLRCIPDATPISVRNHHSHQMLDTEGAGIGVADAAVATPGATFIARRMDPSPDGRCGVHLVTTDMSSQGGRCVELSEVAAGRIDIMAAPCRDADQQVWLMENHYLLDGVMWQRLHSALDDSKCLQQQSDVSTGRVVAQVAACSNHWLQQWDVHEITDLAEGDAGGVAASGGDVRSCSQPVRLLLVGAAGSTAGAPEVSVRACTTTAADRHHAVLEASSVPALADVRIAWRIELHGCRTGYGLTAQDYTPVLHYKDVSTFDTTTLGIPTSAETDTYTANGRVGWIVVTDSAGRHWHTGQMASPINTECV